MEVCMKALGKGEFNMDKVKWSSQMAQSKKASSVITFMLAKPQVPKQEGE
jgi:hypothetical protein